MIAQGWGVTILALFKKTVKSKTGVPSVLNCGVLNYGQAMGASSGPCWDIGTYTPRKKSFGLWLQCARSGLMTRPWSNGAFWPENFVQAPPLGEGVKYWWLCRGGGGALRRLPPLGPNGNSGPAPVAMAAKPQGGSAAHNAAQHAEPAEAHSETCQHTTACSTQYSRTKQSSVPQQWRRTATPPAASTNTSPTPNAQGGARPTTRTLHPRAATAARKQGTRANLKGRPWGLGLGPANGWAAPSKRFGGYPNSAPTGERPCPGSRSHHASLRQRSTPEPAEAHNETRHHTIARGTQYSRAKQSSVPQQQRRIATPPAASTNTSPTPNTQGGGQTHHMGTSPTHSHCYPQTRHARGASPRAQDPTPQRQHGTHHTNNNQGHIYTQHRRDASSPSRPHREEKATQT